MKQYGTPVLLLLAALIFSGCMLLGTGPGQQHVTSADGPESDEPVLEGEGTEAGGPAEPAEATNTSGTSVPVNSEKTQEEASVVAALKKVYIGISDFEILNDEPVLKALAKDIPQTLTRVFIDSRYIKPVDRQEFDTIFHEIKLSMSGITDEETAVEAGKLIGAEYILLGSFIKLGNQIKITSRMVRTETSEIVHTEQVRGSYEALFDLEEELADKIEAYVVELDHSKW